MAERIESPEFLEKRLWYLSRVIRATELKLKIDCSCNLFAHGWSVSGPWACKQASVALCQGVLGSDNLIVMSQQEISVLLTQLKDSCSTNQVERFISNIQKFIFLVSSTSQEFSGRYLHLKTQRTHFIMSTFGTHAALHKLSSKWTDLAALCHRWEVLLLFLHPICG